MARDTYDFWLFDLDGTVVDVDPEYPRKIVTEIGDRLGHAFSDREAELLWYGLGDAREEVFADRTLTPDRFWETFHEVEDPYARAESTFVYDDAAAFVRDLDRPTGLVTHCQSYLTEPLLEYHDIADWFDIVVCCDDEVGWKPDPTPVEHAMNGLGVGTAGHRGALVGDNPDDVGAAWNAGLDAVHIERIGPSERGQCVLGDHRVGGFDEL
ncbi:HAD-superfamily hydrolase [Halosimplex carlsbadense 2-9-1]|uniref:HAD-superfamily hydrolase n=1 Tax=Halosimplex carlsbadense 2-9-1 TaxID=797114 RepID=M0CNH4_9EURY|nr:HAD family hydrolase [Halosimplex carlsbadense]ELZ24820.1 HAD-superfamily hydrolase [Halosimplex carlsbadense 2-9-1]